MCWPNTYRNLVPNLKHLGSIDKHLSAKLLADIEDLQWSALSESVFKHAYELLEMKYFNEFEKNSTILPALKEFFQYMRKVWIESAENKWFEGAHAFRSSNNQGIEGRNREIKASHTFGKRMPLGSFIDVMLNLVHEYSLEDTSLLTSERSSLLFKKPDGLKLRSEGYSWFQRNSKNTNYVKIPVVGRQTLLADLGFGTPDAVWAVPSSNSDKSIPLKELAKSRMLNRFATVADTFDNFMMDRKLCWIVEEMEGEFYCDCCMGIKGRLCKHAVGLMYKTGKL